MGRESENLHYIINDSLLPELNPYISGLLLIQGNQIKEGRANEIRRSYKDTELHDAGCWRVNFQYYYEMHQK